MRQILELIQGRVERLSVSLITPLLSLEERSPESINELNALSLALLNTLLKLLGDHSQAPLFDELIEQLCELYERLQLPLGVCAVARLLTTLERHLLASFTEDNVTISALMEWRRATLSLTERLLSEVALIEAARPSLTSPATALLSRALLSERERSALHAPLLHELKGRLDERSALSARHLYWTESADPLWWRLSLGALLQQSQLTTLSVKVEGEAPPLPWQLTRTLARSLSELLSELLSRAPQRALDEGRAAELMSAGERLRLWAEPLDLDGRGATARLYLEQLTPLSRRVWLTRAFQLALTALSEPSATSKGLLLWLELDAHTTSEERAWLWELLRPLTSERSSPLKGAQDERLVPPSTLIVVLCAPPELELGEELKRHPQLSHSPLPHLELSERLPSMLTGLSSLDLARLEVALKGRDLASSWLVLWALAARGELTLEPRINSTSTHSRWALTLSHESLKRLHTPHPERALMRALIYALPNQQRAAHLKRRAQRSEGYDTRCVLSLTSTLSAPQAHPHPQPSERSFSLAFREVSSPSPTAHPQELTFEQLSLLSTSARRPSLFEALERVCDEVSVWWGLSAQARERRHTDRRTADKAELREEELREEELREEALKGEAPKGKERRRGERRAPVGASLERSALERGERAWRERDVERAEAELASALGASARGSAPWARARVSFALLCLERRELDEAELFLREALENATDEREGSLWERARALTLLGLTLSASEREVKRREGARQLREAWRLCLDLGELSLTPLLVTSLATSAIKAGLMGEALEMFAEARRATSALRWPSSERLLHGALASCWLELGALSQARGSLQEALLLSYASPLSEAQELREGLCSGALELALGASSEEVFKLKGFVEELTFEQGEVPSTLEVMSHSRLEAALLLAVALTVYAESISDPQLRSELIEKGVKYAKLTRLHAHATPAHELSARSVEARLRALERSYAEGDEQLKASRALEGVRSEVRARWAAPFERGSLSLTSALRYALVGAEASASHMELLTELELLKPYLVRVSAKGVSLTTLSQRWELQRLAQLVQQPLSEFL